MRHRGGGHKRRYRLIDFKRDKDGVSAVVKRRRVRSEPLGRASRCCYYADGEKRYILAPVGLNVGDRVETGPQRRHQAGQLRCRSRTSRSARSIHNVELQPGRGGQLVRSAGAAIQLMAKEGDYARS